MFPSRFKQAWFKLGVKHVSDAETAAVFAKIGHDARGRMPYDVFVRALILGEGRVLGKEQIKRGPFLDRVDARFLGKVIYPQCKRGVSTPSDWLSVADGAAARSAAMPTAGLELDHVHGFPGLDNLSNNLHVSAEGDAVYYLRGGGRGVQSPLASPAIFPRPRRRRSMHRRAPGRPDIRHGTRRPSTSRVRVERGAVRPQRRSRANARRVGARSRPGRVHAFLRGARVFPARRAPPDGRIGRQTHGDAVGLERARGWTDFDVDAGDAGDGSRDLGGDVQPAHRVPTRADGGDKSRVRHLRRQTRQGVAKIERRTVGRADDVFRGFRTVQRARRDVPPGRSPLGRVRGRSPGCVFARRRKN